MGGVVSEQRFSPSLTSKLPKEVEILLRFFILLTISKVKNKYQNALTVSYLTDSIEKINAANI